MDIEATQSDDEFEDSDDDETTTMERERQAAESVSLRRHDEVDKVLQVARKWENYARQGERATQEKQSRTQKTRSLKRKETANPPTSRPRKRARTEKTSLQPPPNTKPVTAQTSKGQVIIHVPVIPGERELDYELRVYDLIDAAQREADKEALAALRTSQIELQAGKGIVPRPSVPPSPSPIVHPPSSPVVPPPPSPVVPPPPSPVVPPASSEIIPEDRAPSPTFSRFSLSPPPISSAAIWLQNHEARLFEDIDRDDWHIPLLGEGTPPVHRSWSRSPFQGGAVTPPMATTPVHRSSSRSPFQSGALTPARAATPLDRSCSRAPSQNWQSGAVTPAGGSSTNQGS